MPPPRLERTLTSFWSLILGSLQPHSNLECLQISCYQGLKLPGWLIDLANLVLVELDRCKRCSHLPPLGELPLLRFLKIREMDVVECISSEFYGNGVNPFSSLEGLDIDSMPVLETSKTVDKRVNFPRLRILTFKKCPELIELQTFEFGQGTMPRLLQNQTHLEELTIASLPELKSLLNQLDNLSMVKHLNFNGCKKLEDIPEALQNLNALESLILRGCNSLFFASW